MLVNGKASSNQLCFDVSSKELVEGDLYISQQALNHQNFKVESWKVHNFLIYSD